MERYSQNKIYQELEQESVKTKEESNKLEQKVKVETILKENTENFFNNFSIYGDDI